MRIPLTTRESVRHVCPWHKDGAGAPNVGAPVYLLRPGGVAERALFEAELAGEYHAGMVYPHELREAALDGLQLLLKDAPQMLDRAIEVAIAACNRVIAPGPDAETWAKLDAALREAGGQYAALAAKAERRAVLLPLLAAQRWLAGWEGVKSVRSGELLAYRVGIDGRADPLLLEELDPIELQSVGMAAFEIQYAGPPAPLSLPSNVDSGRKTSRSAGKTRGAGRGQSRVSNGRKTRGSS